MKFHSILCMHKSLNKSRQRYPIAEHWKRHWVEQNWRPLNQSDGGSQRTSKCVKDKVRKGISVYIADIVVAQKHQNNNTMKQQRT